MDTYEASAWRVPDPTGSNRGLVKKIRKGRITSAAQLISAGASQLGVANDDFAPCGDTGETCTDVFALSLPGVKPSAHVTWFQAQQACGNAGKRLPTSAEWQQAVIGSPDPAGDNGTTDCNSDSGGTVDTGSRSDCVSTSGAYDMVGNLHEWVADWVPFGEAAPGWGGLSNDYMGFAGANPASTSPAALLRGGHFQNNAAHAGPLTIDALVTPMGAQFRHGFRCAR